LIRPSRRSLEAAMACFSLALIEQLLIAAVVFVAIYAIIMLLLPYVTSYMSVGGALGTAVTIIVAIIKIVFWAVVAIVVIKFAFEMIQCLLGSFSFPSLVPHR
jgi:hypothetical protein